MKKAIITIVLLCVAATCFAQTFTENGFNFSVLSTNPNEVEVTGGNGNSSPLVIPSTATDGNDIVYTVTTIGNSAYRNGASNGVILPNTITTISFRAFRDNNGLTTITLPASVTSVGGEAFFGGGLNEVIALGTVPSSISNSSFGTRSNVSLEVPDGLEETYLLAGWTGFNTVNDEIPVGNTFNVGDLRYRVTSQSPLEVEVANRLNGIVAIVIPPTVVEPQFGGIYTVTAVGNSAFRNAGINSVVFANTIETIKNEAFENNNLTTITFPAAVTSIETDAFLNNNLSQITLNSGPETIGDNAFRGNQLTSVTIPSGTVTIGRGAFFNNQLSTVSMSTGVITIGREAFRNNILTSVTLPNTIETINTDAFLDNQITSVNLPSNLTTLGSSAFRNNQLTSIVIPDGITDLRSNAFRNNNLQSVTLPSNLQSIRNDVFRDNELTSISFPASLTELQGFSFRNNKLTSVTTPANIATVALHTFSDNLLTEITITSNITSIQDNAFSNNPINTITADSATPATIESNSFGGRSTINLSIIPDQQTVIDDYVAVGWTGFGSVNGAFQVGAQFTEGDFRYEVTTVSPNTVKVLDRQTTSQNISIPAVVTETNSGTSFDVTAIEASAFQNTDITSVTIVSNIELIGANAFQGASLTAVNAQGTPPPVISASSFGDRSVINLTVLFGLEATYANAGWTGFFSVNGQITDGAIGATFGADGITYEITSVSPNEVEVLGGSVMGNLIIPAQASHQTFNFSVTTIRASAFQNDSITSVTLPASITDIGANAFTTDSLTEVTALGTTPATIETNSFGANENISLTIPNGTETTYSTAGWTGFFSVNGSGPSVGNRFTVNSIRYEILTLSPNTLSAVARNGTVPNNDYVFPELLTKNGVDFTITTIGNSAFRNRNVSTISLPSTVTTIEFRGFRDNNNLLSVTIPSGVSSIGSEAFFDTGLVEVISEITNPPSVNNGTFGDKTKTNLFIPQGTRQAYIDAGWTGFKSIIEQGATIVEPKVFLQGALLNPNTGEENLMRDDLRAANLIPTTSPYADALTCNANVFNATGNDAIVDWVFVELRDASDSTTIIEGQSALLQRDGDVVGTNGGSILKFNAQNANYFLVVKHRNHLGIMTASSLQLDGNRMNVDFTNATNQITFGNNAQTEAGMPANIVGMWSGNVNGDTIVQYLGGTPDTTAILSAALNDPGNFLNFSTFIINGYNDNDVNMSGTTQYEGGAADSPLILQNVLAHPGNFLNFSTFQIQEQLPEN